jgi:hypothetical protein
MMGRWKKMETIIPPIITYYRNQRDMKKTEAQIQLSMKQR